jgi:hypothetical protein
MIAGRDQNESREDISCKDAKAQRKEENQPQMNADRRRFGPEPGMDETAYRRIGDARSVGRKSRRAVDGPFRLTICAPDLSRAVWLRPRCLDCPGNDNDLGITARTHGSNPARKHRSKWFVRVAPRFSPYRCRIARTPKRPHAETPTRRNAHTQQSLALRVRRRSLAEVAIPVFL